MNWCLLSPEQDFFLIQKLCKIFFIYLFIDLGYQPQALMMKPLGVHARVARVVVEVKEVLVEVVVVVIQYNNNLPSRSSGLSLTPDSNFCSSASPSLRTGEGEA